jgi:hypothetical protein
VTLSAEERAAKNRKSASFSTGPKSEIGKFAASRNSLVHGLRASKHVLAGECPEAHAALAERWRQQFPSDAPDQEALRDRAVYSTILMHRGADFYQARAEQQVRSAERRFDFEQEDQALAVAANLEADPANTVRLLKRTSAGCRLLLQKWSGLLHELNKIGGWNAYSQRDLALRLLGLKPEDLQDDARVYWFCLFNVRSHLKEDEPVPDKYRDRDVVPVMVWPYLDREFPDREACRRELRAIVDQERTELVAREEALRREFEEPDRAGARAGAMLLHGEDERLWQRYTRMHESSFYRSLKGLRRRTDGEGPEPEPEPSIASATAGPPEGSEGSANPEVGSGEEAVAPNEASCVMPAGAIVPAQSPAAEAAAPREARGVGPTGAILPPRQHPDDRGAPSGARGVTPAGTIVPPPAVAAPGRDGPGDRAWLPDQPITA